MALLPVLVVLTCLLQPMVAQEYTNLSHIDVHIGPSDGVSIPPVLGTSTRLNCSVTLHPQLNPSLLNIHYQWSSNGSPKGSGQELVLSNLSPADATTYSCQVTVSVADPGLLLRQISNVSSYVLMIKIPTPNIQRTSYFTLYYVGEDLNVTCTSSVMGAVITWRAVTTAPKPLILPNTTINISPHSSVLVFKPITFSNVGVNIICTATLPGNENIIGAETTPVFLQTTVPMLSVSVSSSANTVLNISGYNSFTLKCVGTFSPYISLGVLSFMWTRNGEPVTGGLSTGPVESSGVTVTQNSSLQQTASSGPVTLVYNCTVDVSISGTIFITKSSTAQITVKVPMLSVSVFSSANTVLDISGYNSFTLQCGGTFSPYISLGVLSFMWTRNSEPVTGGLSTDPVVSSGLIVTQNSSVQQTASSGPVTLVYNCTVDFSVSGTIVITKSSTAQITVKGPSLPAAPVVQQPPVTSPTSALIRWAVPEVTYSPEQYTVYYTLNSSSCPDSDEGYNKSGTVYGLNHTDFLSIRDQQYSVTLNNLHPYTVYCYKVVARNTEGRNESTLSTFETTESAPSGPPQDFNISVTSRTLILSWSPPLLSLQNGVITSYGLTCSSGGNIINSTRTSSTSLTITGLEPFTNYTCSVSASTVVANGPAAVRSVVTDEEIPGSPPAGFKGVAVGSRSITLHWNSPLEANGIITKYYLQCSGDGDEQMFSSVLNGSQTTTTLSGLLPYTNYSCSITAHTSVGGGPATTISVVTEQDAPSGSPQDFNISATSRTLTLLWSTLLPSQQNGVITSYVLTCNSGGNIIHSTKTNSTSLSITGLEPFTKYICSVSASTVVGDGPAAVRSVVTDEERPGSPPAGFGGVAVGSRSITLTWNSPLKANGIITNYLLRCSGNEQKFSPIWTGSQTTTTLSGLLPYTNYSCSITAHTSVGGGPATTTSVVTEQDVPSRVRGVRVQSSESSTTILIMTWQPPATPNGVITRYELNVSTSTSTVYHNDTISPREQLITIHNLVSHVPYYVKVAAHTVKGRGPYSDTVVNFTSEGIPRSGPSLTNVTRLSGSSVALSWDPLSLEEARGFINGYTVTAQPANTQQRQDGTLTVPVRPSENMAVLEGLDPTLTYWVSVSASTAAGTSTNNSRVFVGLLMATHVPDFPVTIIVVVASCLVLLLLILLIGITSVLCYFRHIKKSDQITLAVAPAEPSHGFEIETLKYKELPCKEIYELKQDGHNWRYQPIMVEAFPDHVKRMHREDDDEFEREFQTFANIPPGSNRVAKLSHNISKNRFQNISPYDSCRVELTPIKGVEGSDYINASWINGCARQKAYIAAQGPLEKTVDDFWRMVWELRLPTIVMLTRLVEAAKKKCSCYWPEKLDETVTLSNGLTVKLVEENIYKEYKLKKLLLTNTNEEDSQPLVVTHYLFTEWPDHEVPRDKMSMISFIQRVRMTHPPEGPPLLVHCSAGVGRTGTFIVLDTMLQRMKAEGNLNIYEFISQLREQRCFMVQTQSQYAYIHDALAEHMLCGDTSFALLDAHKAITALRNSQGGRTGFHKQFELLEELSQNLQNTSTFDAEAANNVGKNRYDYNLPFNHSRVRMIPHTQQKTGDYINASWVDSYQKKNGFIAAQAPMGHTVEEMWQMVWERKSRVIVLLCPLTENGTEVCEEYWPTAVQETLTAGKLIVQLVSEMKEESVTIRKFEVSKKQLYVNIGSEVGLQVTQFHYQLWPEAGAPSSTDSLLTLVDNVASCHGQAGNGPITVMCNDGVGRTGAFMTIYSQLERLKVEQTADVFQFVKASRLKRKGLIRHLEHYIFCHDVLEEFIEHIEKHGNVETDV